MPGAGGVPQLRSAGQRAEGLPGADGAGSSWLAAHSLCTGTDLAAARTWLDVTRLLPFCKGFHALRLNHNNMSERSKGPGKGTAGRSHRAARLEPSAFLGGTNKPSPGFRDFSKLLKKTVMNF